MTQEGELRGYLVKDPETKDRRRGRALVSLSLTMNSLNLSLLWCKMGIIRTESTPERY